MPSLVRFLTIVAVAVALVFGTMVLLATFVKPNRGEITERIPAERLNPTIAPEETE